MIINYNGKNIELRYAKNLDLVPKGGITAAGKGVQAEYEAQLYLIKKALEVRKNPRAKLICIKQIVIENETYNPKNNLLEITLKGIPVFEKD